MREGEISGPRSELAGATDKPDGGRASRSNVNETGWEEVGVSRKAVMALVTLGEPSRNDGDVSGTSRGRERGKS